MYWVCAVLFYSEFMPHFCLVLLPYRIAEGCSVCVCVCVCVEALIDMLPGDRKKGKEKKVKNRGRDGRKGEAVCLLALFPLENRHNLCWSHTRACVAL